MQDAVVVGRWNELKWQTRVVDAWASTENIHLTCVPTLAGFSGRQQLSGFSGSNFWTAQTWQRFSNQCQTLSQSVSLLDASLGTIADANRVALVHEEVWVQMLHGERLDWLLPGQSATQKDLCFAVSITAHLVLEGASWKLQSVKYLWDGLTVWIQSGLLLEYLKVSARKASAPDSILAEFTSNDATDYRRVRTRLLHPSGNNIVALAGSGSTPPAHLVQNPMNQRTELSALPERGAVASPSRATVHPAFRSDVHLSSPESVAPADVQHRSNPALQSSMAYGTEFSSPSTPVPSVKLAQRNTLLADSPMVTKTRPSFAVDPGRMRTQLVTPADDAPIVPVVPALDPARFAESTEAPEGSSIRILNPERFQSRIFDSDAPTAPVVSSIKLQPHMKMSSVMLATQAELENSLPQDDPTSMMGKRAVDPHRNEGHGLGYYLDSAEGVQISPARGPQKQMRRDGNASSLGTMMTTDLPQALALNSRNASSIAFDFDAPERLQANPALYSR